MSKGEFNTCHRRTQINVLFLPFEGKDTEAQFLLVARIFTPKGRNLFARLTPIAPNPRTKTYRKGLLSRTQHVPCYNKNNIANNS